MCAVNTQQNNVLNALVFFFLMLNLVRYSASEENTSPFSKPKVTKKSARCAAVEFEHDDENLKEVFVFAKRPVDSQPVQWGDPLSVRKKEKPGEFQILMTDLPPGEKFQVLLSNDMHWDEVASNSPWSDWAWTRETFSTPDEPHALMIHRTDPRLNRRLADGSVCVDLHWTHPHTVLKDDPDDIYFRISREYIGERREVLCADDVGEPKRRCGTPIESETSVFPESYMNLCNLRPDRRLRFDVEAFNCDGRSVARHVSTVSPPTAPNVVFTLQTSPGPQESIAGFQPMIVIDWIPQHDEMVEGHGVYLGLTDISAEKLLCWVPHGKGCVPPDKCESDLSDFAAGHLEIPIQHKNHTSAEDSQLLDLYIHHFHVHQEQEIRVSTRVQGKLESPATVFRLGDWLVMDMVLKCLTSYESQDSAYVSYPVIVSWTQQQGMTLYD